MELEDDNIEEYEWKEMGEEELEELLSELRNTFQMIEALIVGLYTVNVYNQTHLNGKINELESKNESYREEIKTLYQELADLARKENKE